MAPDSIRCPGPVKTGSTLILLGALSRVGSALADQDGGARARTLPDASLPVVLPSCRNTVGGSCMGGRFSSPSSRRGASLFSTPHKGDGASARASRRRSGGSGSIASETKRTGGATLITSITIRSSMAWRHARTPGHGPRSSGGLRADSTKPTGVANVTGGS